LRQYLYFCTSKAGGRRSVFCASGLKLPVYAALSYLCMRP
jgi:hypothetical protein